MRMSGRCHRPLCDCNARPRLADTFGWFNRRHSLISAAGTIASSSPAAGSIGHTVSRRGNDRIFTWDTAGTIGGGSSSAPAMTPEHCKSDRGNLSSNTVGQWWGRYGYADLFQHDDDDVRPLSELGKRRAHERSAFTLDSNFVVGDSGTATGSFSASMRTSTLLRWQRRQRVQSRLSRRGNSSM